jgi:hypothetical protein
MSMYTSKLRGNTAPKFYTEAKKAKKNSGGGSFPQVAGRNDRLKLGAEPIWLRFSPDQIYNQLVWDSSSASVIEVVRPWFESVSHFIPSRNRGFNCSAGAHRDQACRGCATRAWFYDKLRAKEKSIAEQTGVDPRRDKENKEKSSPPVQASKVFAMSATVLEKCITRPLMSGGKARTDRNGNTIMQTVPAPLSGLPLIERKKADGVFGHNYHYGFGQRALASLGNIDADLWNSCANCASDLVAREFMCAECGTVCFDEPDGVSGSDLRGMREQEVKCQACGHEGGLVPALACTGCENPAEGSLLAFDLRLRAVKIDDTNTQIELVEFRVPDYMSIYPDATTAERVCELVMSPLDIPAIYAPDNIERQNYAMPDDLKQIDAMYHCKKKSSAAYGSADDEGEGGDPNQMRFND